MLNHFHKSSVRSGEHGIKSVSLAVMPGIPINCTPLLSSARQNVDLSIEYAPLRCCFNALLRCIQLVELFNERLRSECHFI